MIRNAQDVAREWYLKQDFMHCSDAHAGYGVCAKCDEEVHAIATLIRADRADVEAAMVATLRERP